jgi:hypothetical protein
VEAKTRDRVEKAVAIFEHTFDIFRTDYHRPGTVYSVDNLNQRTIYVLAIGFGAVWVLVVLWGWFHGGLIPSKESAVAAAPAIDWCERADSRMNASANSYAFVTLKARSLIRLQFLRLSHRFLLDFVAVTHP